MYGLLLLRVLRARAAHDGLRSIRTMIRRIGRCFSCRRRYHMTRRTSGAGRYRGFARGVRLLAGVSRRGLWECARHLFGGGLYGIRLCSNRLSRNRFLIECRIRAVLLRRRAMMITFCFGSTFSVTGSLPQKPTRISALWNFFLKCSIWSGGSEQKLSSVKPHTKKVPTMPP